MINPQKRVVTNVYLCKNIGNRFGNPLSSVGGFRAKANYGENGILLCKRRGGFWCWNTSQPLKDQKMNNSILNLGFTPEIVPDCHHICLIYDNDEQRQKIVSAYLAAGIKDGNIVRYFADDTPAQDVHDWMAEAGLNLPLEENDAFRVLRADEAYCPSGQFIPQETIHRAIERYAAAQAAGYSGSRVTGEMSWVLRDIPGSERLLKYEMGLNAIQDSYPRVGMCQYDARRFDGALLFKILQVHPYMIAQGRIVRNPFYLRPDEPISQKGIR